MTFTYKELLELKFSINEMINSRWTYINSPDTTEEEMSFSKMKITEDYSLLSTILELISKEENK